MTAPGFTVARLGPGDVPLLRGVNALFAEVFAEPATYAGAPPGDAYLEARLADRSCIALVALHEGAVIGGLVAYELRKFEQERSEIYIYDLAVAGMHRRRGVATRLIEAVRAIAAERGAWMIFVQADHGDEPAIALYTSLGTREDVLHFDIEPARGDRR